MARVAKAAEEAAVAAVAVVAVAVVPGRRRVGRSDGNKQRAPRGSMAIKRYVVHPPRASTARLRVRRANCKRRRRFSSEVPVCLLREVSAGVGAVEWECSLLTGSRVQSLWYKL